jgi:hypothetical protein
MRKGTADSGQTIWLRLAAVEGSTLRSDKASRVLRMVAAFSARHFSLCGMFG